MKITQQIKVVEEARHDLEKARDLIFDAGTSLEAVDSIFKGLSHFYAVRYPLDIAIQHLKDYEAKIRAEDLNKEQTKIQDA